MKKKIIKKKSTFKTETNSSVLYDFNPTSKIEYQQLNENFNIEDPAVENFKKILAFQSINANNVNKIKPKLKNEWQSAITY